MKKRSKKDKTSIVFDEASRKDFLTGFRKRKNERRKQAKEQLEKDLKEEIRKAKQKAREDVIHAKATGASHRIVPEIEHLIRGEASCESTIQDYGAHTVSITHLNGFGTRDDVTIAEKQPQNAKEREESINQSLTLNTIETKGPLSKDQLRNINKLAAKKLSKTRAFSNAKQMRKKGTKSLTSNNFTRHEKFSQKTAKSKRSKHYNPKKITT